MRSDLKWNSHVDSIIEKASKRLYFLRQLMKRANVPAAEMICFDCTCIRPIIEYASPVFSLRNPKLPK
jgi:hypothetical protein